MAGCQRGPPRPIGEGTVLSCAATLERTGSLISRFRPCRPREPPSWPAAHTFPGGGGRFGRTGRWRRQAGCSRKRGWAAPRRPECPSAALDRHGRDGSRSARVDAPRAVRAGRAVSPAGGEGADLAAAGPRGRAWPPRFGSCCTFVAVMTTLPHVSSSLVAGSTHCTAGRCFNMMWAASLDGAVTVSRNSNPRLSSLASRHSLPRRPMRTATPITQAMSSEAPPQTDEHVGPG